MLQNYSLKKKVRERLAREKLEGSKTGEEDPTLVLPALAKIEAKSYRPGKQELPGLLLQLTLAPIYYTHRILLSLTYKNIVTVNL